MSFAKLYLAHLFSFLSPPVISHCPVLKTRKIRKLLAPLDTLEPCSMKSVISSTLRWQRAMTQPQVTQTVGGNKWQKGCRPGYILQGLGIYAPDFVFIIDHRKIYSPYISHLCSHHCTYPPLSCSISRIINCSLNLIHVICCYINHLCHCHCLRPLPCLSYVLWQKVLQRLIMSTLYVIDML